jgi:hypothetical protein
MTTAKFESLNRAIELKHSSDDSFTVTPFPEFLKLASRGEKSGARHS